jgi:hypothetical protein
MTFGDLKIGNRFAARYSQGFTACNLYEKKSSKSAYDLRATEGGEAMKAPKPCPLCGFRYGCPITCPNAPRVYADTGPRWVQKEKP